MSNQYVFNDRLPLAPLKIAALESCRDLAQKVNDHIVNFRRNDAEELLRRQGNLQYRGYDVDSYLLDCACPRFGSGEAKGIVNESVRGTDIFCMVDVTNHSLTSALRHPPHTVSTLSCRSFTRAVSTSVLTESL